MARCPASLAKESTVFLTHAEVEAMFKKEKEKASVTSAYLPPYSAEVAAKPYPTGYRVPKFYKFDGRKGKTREHVIRFLVFMVPLLTILLFV